MKKILLVCLAVLTAMVVSGCGTALTVSNNLNETKVVLSQKNFEVIGQAHGQASATYIVGIGGLSKKALRTNAIDDMSKNARLEGAQTIVNITTHSSIKVITPFYVKMTFVATGNIIEFNN